MNSRPDPLASLRADIQRRAKFWQNVRQQLPYWVVIAALISLLVVYKL